MKAKPEYRNRDETEVAVLDALADRHEEGMTVFELRSRVDVGIDQLESALAGLNEDDLIEVNDERDRTVIVPDPDVVGPVDSKDDESLIDAIRRRFSR